MRLGSMSRLAAAVVLTCVGLPLAGCDLTKFFTDTSEGASTVPPGLRFICINTANCSVQDNPVETDHIEKLNDNGLSRARPGVSPPGTPPTG
jgi:hypothetical protein